MEDIRNFKIILQNFINHGDFDAKDFFLLLKQSIAA